MPSAALHVAAPDAIAVVAQWDDRDALLEFAKSWPAIEHLDDDDEQRPARFASAVLMDGWRVQLRLLPSPGLLVDAAVQAAADWDAAGTWPAQPVDAGNEVSLRLLDGAFGEVSAAPLAGAPWDLIRVLIDDFAGPLPEPDDWSSLGEALELADERAMVLGEFLALSPDLVRSARALDAGIPSSATTPAISPATITAAHSPHSPRPSAPRPPRRPDPRGR